MVEILDGRGRADLKNDKRFPLVDLPSSRSRMRSEAAATMRMYSTILSQRASFLSSPTRKPRNFSGVAVCSAAVAPLLWNGDIKAPVRTSAATKECKTSLSFLSSRAWSTGFSLVVRDA